MSSNYLGKMFSDNWLLILVAALIAAGMQFLILVLVVEVNLLGLAEAFVSRIPAPMQNFFGQEFLGQFTLSGAVALGYSHPLVLVMLSLVAIQLPARQIAGEIEKGTMELIFALPLTRMRIILSAIFFSGLALFLAAIAGLAGTICGYLVYYPQLQQIDLLNTGRIVINLWFLMLSVNAATYLISSFKKEGNRSAMIAGVMVLIFYFVHYFTRMWPAIHFLEPFTLFAYYRPQQLMAGSGIFLRNSGILLCLAVIFYGWAAYQINRRDIPG